MNAAPAMPLTQYANSDGVSIAYQVVGAGVLDIVFVHGWVSNIELLWDEPATRHFIERLAAFSRVILLDKRGTGLSDRVLATVLFTDIVDATAQAAASGDQRWRELLAAHHARVRQQLQRHRGREIDTAGDGFLASFDGPARAVHCALAAVDAVRPPGLTLRAGVHTGECEILEGKLTGLSVHIGARVAALAGPGEVLASSTVKDLVAGSGLRFAECGAHALKGVPGQWQLYAAAA